MCTVSVRIDVDQLLRDRAAENRQVYRKPGKSHLIKSEPNDGPEPGPSRKANAAKDAKSKTSRKRKSDAEASVTKAKKQKTKSSSASSSGSVASSSGGTLASPAKQIKRVMLKMGPPPPPKEQEFLCCLCPSGDKRGLLRVHDPPAWWYDAANTDAKLGPCMAHEECASVVPETWVDEIEREGEIGTSGENASRTEKVVFGVDAVSKDRWNLVSNNPALYAPNPGRLHTGAEMHRMHEAEEQGPRRQDPVRQSQVHESLPRLVCARRAHEWGCVQGP